MSMKTESAASAGQRETSFHEEKERTDTNFEFPSTFLLLVLTCASSQVCPHRCASRHQMLFTSSLAGIQQ